MQSGSEKPDIAQQLTKLSKLHGDGVLTDEDFKNLKAKVIADASKASYEHSSTKKPAEQASITSQVLINAKNKWFIGIAALLGIGFLIFELMAGGALSCSSQSTTNLIFQLVRKHYGEEAFKPNAQVYAYDLGLTNIRVDDEDRRLKKTSCDATLNWTSKLGNEAPVRSSFDIKYLLETTSDGRLYATVRGLK